MYKLVLIRHGESTWNKENRFTGWTDVDLSERGVKEAIDAGKRLKQEGYSFRVAFTSYLTRAIRTLDLVLQEMDLLWIPVYKTWHLNEKHYGTLQGLNKAEMAAKYGEEQVHIWRRSYDIPPPLAEDDPRNPRFDHRYQSLHDDEIPRTEALKDTVERIVPYWEEVISQSLLAHHEVVVAAHGNSLRGIVKHLKHIPDDVIPGINIPTGIPYVFEFDQAFNLIRDYYLGDPEVIRKLMEEVANQGKKKMKKQWVIPDIHGYLDTLKCLMEEIIRPTRYDEIYLLGDYIDRGPDSKGVIDYIRQLEHDGYTVVPLKGNHEDFLVELYDAEVNARGGWLFNFAKRKRKAWNAIGGKDTMESFAVHHLRDVPPDYIEWMRNLQYYVELDHFVLVHAGLNFKRENPFEDKQAMLWIRDYQILPEKIGNRRIIHGHVPVNMELITLSVRNNFYKFIDIDNGPYVRGRTGFGNLVALELTQMEMVIQDVRDKET